MHMCESKCLPGVRGEGGRCEIPPMNQTHKLKTEKHKKAAGEVK